MILLGLSEDSGAAYNAQNISYPLSHELKHEMKTHTSPRFARH